MAVRRKREDRGRAGTPWARTPVRDGVLDMWQPVPIQIRPDDPEIEVTADVEHRPDLLSWKLWGTPRWWWVFASRNPDLIVDPIADLRTGLKIRVPRTPPS